MPRKEMRNFVALQPTPSDTGRGGGRFIVRLSRGDAAGEVVLLGFGFGPYGEGIEDAA